MSKGAHKRGGHNFHPARISGHQKFLRAKQASKEMENRAKLKHQPLKPLDTSKPDWSV